MAQSPEAETLRRNTGLQGVYEVTSYAELEYIDLTKERIVGN
jgi:hypothetical protein